ncbi:MAG: carboxypeptidase regulatory-like domain-containing protein, partial [Pyrinomonadaceae bacterium]|nr:carboxypeptidase regulatory-like domain-containing protein [Pyrinomonadaceae bacterium]
MNRIKTVINGFAVCILVGLLLNDGFAVGKTNKKLSTPLLSVVKQNRNTISGFVFDSSRQPVPDINVELQDDVSSTLVRTRTSSAGRYTFSGLSAGVFNVKIINSNTSFVEQTQRVEIINININGRIAGYDNVQLDFRLQQPSNNGSSVGSSSSRSNSAIIVFAQDIPKSARKFYEKGLGEIKRNDYDSAVTSMKSAIEIFPTYFLALESLGVESVKRNKYETALPYLIKAIEVNQKAFDSFYALGVAHYNLKNIKEAKDALQKATGINSQSINANFYYGMVLRQIGQTSDAEIFLIKAKTSAKPSNPQIHWQLALLYKQTRRYKNAADELQLFLDSQPDSRDKAQ